MSVQGNSKTTPSNDSASDDESLIGLLTYGLTLPERTARSASAIVGGILNETSMRMIPTVFRSSRTYRVFVQQALDMMVHDVGGVSSEEEEKVSEEESQLAQKAVGGLLDVAGAATLHLSPITVLAVFSDIAYGSSYYLTQLSDELKREGIIDDESSIDHVSDLVDALQRTSDRAADAMDTPPISVDGILQTIQQLADEVSNVDPTKLLPQAEVERIWGEMEATAAAADVGIWEVSTTMTMFALNRVTATTRGALSTVTVASGIFDQHIIGHYSDALDEIAENGLYETLSMASAPYLEAVWHNFDENRETWTEELITGRLFIKAWQFLCDWFRPKKKVDSATEENELEEPKTASK